MQTLIRPGGRRVAVHDLTPDAPADAPVVLLCHAAPGSGAFDPDPGPTAAHGVRLLAPDRPGYGGSDPVTEEFGTVDSAADDAAAVLDERGVRAAVAGWSAGGRVALALAARRRDLVTRVTVFAAPAPDEEVPWYPEDVRPGIVALQGAPAAVAHAALGEVFGPMAELPAEARFELVGVGPADAEALERPGVADRLRGMLDAAFRQGAAGVVADVAGYTLQPWGFDPADVRVPVRLVYGADDPVAGPEHGEWYRKALPDAELSVVTGGHLVVAREWPAAF